MYCIETQVKNKYKANMHYLLAGASCTLYIVQCNKKVLVCQQKSMPLTFTKTIPHTLIFHNNSISKSICKRKHIQIKPVGYFTHNQTSKLQAIISCVYYTDDDRNWEVDQSSTRCRRNNLIFSPSPTLLTLTFAAQEKKQHIIVCTYKSLR